MSIRRLSTTSITSTGGKSSKLWDQETTLGTYESIAVATSDGTANSFQFSNIPQNYYHLQIRITSRSAQAATYDSLYMRFNSDSNTNYSYHRLYGDGSTVTSNNYTPDTIVFPGYTPAASAAASTFGSAIVDILDYTNTSKNKIIRSSWGYDLNGSGQVGLWSGAWYNSSTAITSILINNYSSGANYAAGSIAALYGIRGA